MKNFNVKKVIESKNLEASLLKMYSSLNNIFWCYSGALCSADLDEDETKRTGVIDSSSDRSRGY